MTALLKLTRGQFALVDDEDFERVSPYSWAAKPSDQKGLKYYAQGTVQGRRVYLHRFIMGAEAGQIIDHINGNPLDNRRSNLRFAGYSINNINREYRSSCGYRGVEAFKGKWRGQAQRGGKTFKCRPRPTPEEAARDYDQLAIRLFGREVARLNFPEERH